MSWNYAAIKSVKSHEHPLIGKICSTDGGMVEIEWMVGTYSGLWKQWKGKEGGKTVVFTEKICKEVCAQTLHLCLAKDLHQPP